MYTKILCLFYRISDFNVIRRKKQRYLPAIIIENAKKLDGTVKKSKDLNTDRLELINLILSILFMSTGIMWRG